VGAATAQATALSARPARPARPTRPARPARPIKLADSEPAAAPGKPDPTERQTGLLSLLADGTVRSARDLSPGVGVVSDADLLPVLPALRDLLPLGALQRGSVVAADSWSMLCLALAAGPVAAGAWCAAAGIAEFGVAAAADAGLDPARLLLVPDLGPNWPQVVISLLDGCDLVLLRPTDRPSAQTRRKLEAAVRKQGAVLIVAGNWDGAQVRLRIASQVWTGIGLGHGRLRERKVQVVADGRGSWSRSRVRWLWLPGPDGAVSSVADDLESPGSHELRAELELALTTELEGLKLGEPVELPATAQRSSAG
jgi:hypothetical protein